MLSALGLARAIEAGELTPAQAVELCAEAIAKRESEVGAFVTLDLEGARKAAQQPGLKDKPLRGLPVALKDIFDTADMPTEYGSPIYAGHRPKADASLVALIRRAGGTLIGKTVTTEFAHLDPGKTRNPHNLAHTPGGSSSGSAAGVAAGFFPIATGSQTGGSVIRPASYCGVAGFKPSYRLLPTVGMKCVSWHLDTAGLFAARSPTSPSPRPPSASAICASTARRRHRRASACCASSPGRAASDDMIAALDNVARAASAANARVRDIKLPPVLASAFRAHGTIQAYEAARSLASEYERAKDKLAKGVLRAGRERLCDPRRGL